MAAICPPDIKRAWLKLLPPERVWEIYGGTERIGSTIIGGDDKAFARTAEIYRLAGAADKLKRK